MKNKVTIILFYLFWQTASAATQIINGDGLLSGASNVEVDGRVFNVNFVEGSCTSEFDGCDNRFDDFTFLNGTEGALASQALIDQVFIDSPLGLFDSVPGLTFGCEGNGSCAIHTPRGLTPPIVNTSVAINNRDEFGRDLIDQSRVSPDAVLLYAKWTPALANEAPSAEAGPDQAVRADDTVFLDGSASFDDNTPTASLAYSWSFSLLPAGSSTVLLGVNTVSPSFFVDVAGTYAVQLVVTDGSGLASTPDDVFISSENLAPTADAGLDQLVIVNSTVFLDGSGSTDPESDPLTYSWSISATPLGSIASLVGDDTTLPNFLPDLEGDFEIMLTVSDFIGPGLPDSINITAVSSDQFAVISIVSANQTIVSLVPAQVTTKGNQNALGNFLSQATSEIRSGDIADAIDKLQKALSRTDGCVLRSDVDTKGPGRDWITDCTAQVVLYESLNQALTAITP